MKVNMMQFFNQTPSTLNNCVAGNGKLRYLVRNGLVVPFVPRGTQVSCVRLTLNALKRGDYAGYLQGVSILKGAPKKLKKLLRLVKKHNLKTTV